LIPVAGTTLIAYSLTKRVPDFGLKESR
jgi:hypothetical protein